MPMSGTAESYGGRSIFSVRNLYIVLHSGYIYLHYNQQCRRVLFLHIISGSLYAQAVFVGHSDQCEVISHSSFDIHL